MKDTYNPFFKHIFNPKAHPDRLNRLLSCILGQEVTVRKVLPPERRRISENSSLIIMDILVQLADGCLVNVEMQRVGYEFPVERSVDKSIQIPLSFICPIRSYMNSGRFLLR